VADQFDCKSTNGSIHLQPLAVPNDSQIKLCTTNGSINVALPAWPDLGVAVELQTSVGRVSSQLGQMDIHIMNGEVAVGMLWEEPQTMRTKL